MGRVLNIFFLFFAVFAAASCGAPKLDLSLDFHTKPATPGFRFKGVAGVEEFTDLRPQVSTSDARKWLGFLPGVLWVEFVSEVPDRYTGFSDYRSGPFNASVSQAVFKGIKESGLFEKTLFLPADKYARIDYRIEGVLNRSFLKETGYYYGSSLYSWVTRVAGLPYVSYEVGIEAVIRLRRMDTEEVLWTYNLKGEHEGKYYNIYELTNGKEGKNVLSYNFSKILENEAPALLESLGNALDEAGLKHAD